MTKETNNEPVHVRDKAGRRRFIRSGAALVVAAGAVASRPAFADCDQSGEGQNKPEHAGNGSDNDQGAGSDALGCGRQHKEKPKLSRSAPSLESDTAKTVTVAKVKA